MAHGSLSSRWFGGKIRDVLTTSNPEGLHGDASGLTDQQMDDLCEYVLSL